MPDIITDNPALVTGLAGAVITLLLAFGVHITPDQVQATLGLLAAVLAVLAFWAHKTTVPKTPSAGAEPKSIQSPAPTP